jgi:hypothetical protein
MTLRQFKLRTRRHKVVQQILDPGGRPNEQVEWLFDWQLIDKDGNVAGGGLGVPSLDECRRAAGVKAANRNGRVAEEETGELQR